MAETTSAKIYGLKEMRMEGGFRLYSDQDVERIRLIKQLQSLLGFSLAEIKEMVEAEEIRANLRATRGPADEPSVVRPRAEQALRVLRRQLAVVDPKLMPGIMLGHRFGIMPEIFIAGNETDPAMFMNDESRIKVRHFTAVGVADFRPLHKSNVA